MKLHNIKAILFDSGRVLNGPQTGHWFISPNFFDYVDKTKFDTISRDKKNKAFTMAGEYMNSIKLIETIEDEYYHFKKYYEIFSNELQELNLKSEDIDSLARVLVYNPQKYKFFDDALKVIPILHNTYKLAVVSDAWPSLKEVFEYIDFNGYFDSFIISSIIGVTKPDEKMYLTALNELNVNANDAIFIDDNLKNCIGAKKLGIQAILLCRDKKKYILQKILSIGKGYKVINTLNELL